MSQLAEGPTLYYPRTTLTAEVKAQMKLSIDRTLMDEYFAGRFPEEYLERSKVVFTHQGLNADGGALTTTPHSSPESTFGVFERVDSLYSDGSSRQDFRISLNAPLIVGVSEMGLELVTDSYKKGIDPGENMSVVLIHELEHFYECIQRLEKRQRAVGDLSLAKLFPGARVEYLSRKLRAIEEEERVRRSTAQTLKEHPEFSRILAVRQ